MREGVPSALGRLGTPPSIAGVSSFSRPLKETCTPGWLFIGQVFPGSWTNEHRPVPAPLSANALDMVRIDVTLPYMERHVGTMRSDPSEMSPSKEGSSSPAPPLLRWGGAGAVLGGTLFVRGAISTATSHFLALVAP